MVVITDKQAELTKRWGYYSSTTGWEVYRWLFLLFLIPITAIGIYYRFRKRKVIATQTPMPEPLPPQQYYYNPQYGQDQQQGNRENDLPPQPTPAYVPPPYDQTGYSQQQTTTSYEQVYGQQQTTTSYEQSASVPNQSTNPTDEFSAPPGPPPPSAAPTKN